MTQEYKGRTSHYLTVETQIGLPIYSENYHNIDGEWVSIDDIDEKNICYRKFSLDKIRRFITPQENHRGFKSEYCILELFNGEQYPIHGSKIKWENQYEEWRKINKELTNKMNNEFYGREN